MKNNLSCRSFGLCFLRISISALFVFSGVMKYLNPEMFRSMLESKLYFSGMGVSIAFWAVVATEVFGGIILLLGKYVPRFLYDIAIAGLFVILIVAIFGVLMPGKNFSGALTNLVLIGVLTTLFSFRSNCPYKNDCCEMK